MSDDRVVDLAQAKRDRGLSNDDKSDASNPETEVPDFITPKSIATMTDAQLDDMLEVLRLRRMTATLQYEKTVAEKEALARDKAVAQLEKKNEQVFKALERTTKALEALETRVIEMRAFRLQAGLEF